MSIAAEASLIWEATAAVTRPPSTRVGSERIAGPLVVVEPAQRGDLGLEAALGPGPQRPLVALDGEDLHVLPTDVPLLGDELGAPELADLPVAVAGHPALAAGERVLEAERGGERHGAADRDLGHLLHAAGHDDVVHAGHHGLGGEVDGLLGGAALAVDRGARDVLGEPGGQPAGAGDVAGLAPDRVDAAEHDVLDGGGVDPRALHERAERVGPEVGGVDLAQAPAPAPDGGADGVDDEGFGHRVAPGQGMSASATRSVWKAVSPQARVRAQERLRNRWRSASTV
jgi:hypothetical protein